MLSSVSPIAAIVFAVVVAVVVGISFYASRRRSTAEGSIAADGGVHWFAQGFAFAGEYLSIAFLGVCGLIAYYGFDGFLYAIGFVAGWVLVLFLGDGPNRGLGKLRLAESLDAPFNSRGIRLAAGVSTLVVCILCLIPQIVGARSLMKAMLGLPTAAGIILVGVFVILIAVSAGWRWAVWMQWISGVLLVLFCAAITPVVLSRGITSKGADAFPRILDNRTFAEKIAAAGTALEPSGAWARLPYVRVRMSDGSIRTWRYEGQSANPPMLLWPSTFIECQTLTTPGSGPRLVNGKPQAKENDLVAAGFVDKLQDDATATGGLGPMSFLAAFQHAQIGLPKSEKVIEEDGATTMVYYSKITPGGDVMSAGNHPTLFKGIKSHDRWDQLNFISLLLALFCGTAALPWVLGYSSAKDSKAASKATAVCIVAIGVFFILMLYLGLGAMTQGTLAPDFADSGMAGLNLAKTFGPFVLAILAAAAFMTVLGAVRGIIVGASEGVAGDVLHHFLKTSSEGRGKVRTGNIAAVMVGIVAILLALACRKLNVAFLAAWAFNVAASAHLPAMTMPRVWKGTTKQGVTASIVVGLVSSMTWIMISSDAYINIYGRAAAEATIRMNQPALFTIPLAFVTLIAVSLMTRKRGDAIRR